MKKFKIRFGRQNVKNFFKFILNLVFLPFIILTSLWFDRKQKFLKRVLVSLIVLLIMLPIWGAGILGAGLIGGVFSGLIPQTREIEGNSMLPTLHDGEFVNFKFHLNFKGRFGFMNLLYGSPKRGDIIVFYVEDKNVDYVKRIVGIPGDTLEIRAGYVFINSEPLRENYISSPRSTFGNEFLRDCQKIEIPEGNYFVLGDNRKQSKDSRTIGLIPEGNIHALLSFKNQRKFEERWSVSVNANDFNQPTLDQQEYYELLNKERKEMGLAPLKSNKKLENSAKKRAETMIEFNDFSIEATRSGYTMEKAMKQAGYYNILRWEVFTSGYFTAKELINHFFEFSDIKDQLLREDYQDTGIAAVVGDVNECPIQVVVQDVGGYVPPNYKKEDIEGWRETLNRLKEIQPSWERLKTYQKFYQDNKDDIDRITSIINQRIGNIEAIVRRMEANQWLTEEERRYAENDKTLYDQQESLATKINAK